MLKRVSVVAVLLCVMSSTSFGQTTGVCAKTKADSLLLLFNMLKTVAPDSIDSVINSLTVAANSTCDSATINATVKLLATPMTVKFAGVKKIDSCQLRVTYSPAAKLLLATLNLGGFTLNDTVINACTLPVVHGLSRQFSATQRGVSFSFAGSRLVASGTTLAGADQIVVRVFDQRGKCVKTLTHSGEVTGAVSWVLDRPSSTLLFVLERNGRIAGTGVVSAGR